MVEKIKLNHYISTKFIVSLTLTISITMEDIDNYIAEMKFKQEVQDYMEKNIYPHTEKIIALKIQIYLLYQQNITFF